MNAYTHRSRFVVATKSSFGVNEQVNLCLGMTLLCIHMWYDSLVHSYQDKEFLIWLYCAFICDMTLTCIHMWYDSLVLCLDMNAQESHMSHTHVTHTYTNTHTHMISRQKSLLPLAVFLYQPLSLSPSPTSSIPLSRPHILSSSLSLSPSLLLHRSLSLSSSPPPSLPLPNRNSGRRRTW